jgi:anti-anti-sigma factor
MKYQIHNSRLVVKFEGDLQSTTVNEMKPGFAAIFNKATVHPEPWNELELDLSRARMIDSAGLNLLMTLVKASQERKTKVIARVASKTVQRIIQFTRLDRSIELVMQAD